MGAVLYGAGPGNRENLANMLTLYGHPESGHTYKVALTLALMAEPFEYRWVDVFAPRGARDPQFQRVSRFGEIPVLVDADIAYAQSDAILLHLAGKHARLGGETPLHLTPVRERLFWEANRIGISLPNLRHYRLFAAGTAPEGALEWLRARLLADLAALNDALASQPFLSGETVTVADIACSAYLLYEDAGLDLTQWPEIQAWLGRIRALPGWQHPHVLLRKPD
jgi:glutathione S-transferase